VEFINSWAIARIDCLLLDISMPDVNGFALQNCLRNTNYQFPIIFCSGQDALGDKERALANGAVYFLQKPVRSEELITAVRTACAASAAAKHIREAAAEKSPGRCSLAAAKLGR